MIKSTEWGAIEILSLSGYGNGSTSMASRPISSTTGNASGVYFLNSSVSEYTAGVATVTGTVGANVRDKYYNLYAASKTATSPGTETSSAIEGGPKAGDALGDGSLSLVAGQYPGCAGWQGGLKRWFPDNSNTMVRGCRGITAYGFGTSVLDRSAVWNESLKMCRGVAIVGVGF